MTVLMRCSSALLVLAPFALLGQAQDSSVKPPAIAKISGYATGSFTSSTRHGTGQVVGRLYGYDHNQVMANVADIVVERVAATDRVDVGFRLEPTFGSNAGTVKSAGLDLGRHADILQAFATVNFLHAKDRYFQLKAGKFATLMGVEVFEDVLNPTLDVGNQTAFILPFTETGLELDGKFGAHVDAELRVTQGWDLVSDNNSAKSVMFRVGLTPDAATLIALTAFTGPEQAGDNSTSRRGGELLASRQLGAVTGWLEFDYGEEAMVAVAGGKAKWSAVGVWLRADLSPTVSLGGRADYMNDRDGARTSGLLGFPVNNGQSLSSFTANVALKLVPHTMLRPEIRYDHSSLPVFDGNHAQWSAGLGFSVLF